MTTEEIHDEIREIEDKVSALEDKLTPLERRKHELRALCTHLAAPAPINKTVHCQFCGHLMGWSCIESPVGACEYEWVGTHVSDTCKWCHEPEERK